MNDLTLSLTLAMKLGSIVVHADELTSSKGVSTDAETIRSLMQDEEVLAWIQTMGPLLPVKR